MVFAITDNDRCISLRGYQWLQPFLKTLGMPLHIADGTDLLSTYEVCDLPTQGLARQ